MQNSQALLSAFFISETPERIFTNFDDEILYCNRSEGF